MKLILLLSKEHLKLAQDEAIAIIKPSKVIKHSNLLILETNNPEKVLIKPNLIEVIGDLLDKRGHGNEPVLMGYKELKEIKNKVYTNFKQLQDIENG